MNTNDREILDAASRLVELYLEDNYLEQRDEKYVRHDSIICPRTISRVGRDGARVVDYEAKRIYRDRSILLDDRQRLRRGTAPEPEKTESLEAIARRLDLLDERILLYGVREFLTGAMKGFDRTGGLHEDTRARVKRFLRESEPGAILDDPHPTGGQLIDAPGIASAGRRDDPEE